MVQSYLAAPPSGLPVLAPDGWRGIRGIDSIGHPLRPASTPESDVWPISKGQPVLAEPTRP
eukprot:3070022-Heterocapsa_arctica.AAC.1